MLKSNYFKLRTFLFFLVLLISYPTISARTKVIIVESEIMLTDIKIINSKGETSTMDMFKTANNDGKAAAGKPIGGPCYVIYRLFFRVEKGIEWVKIEHEKLNLDINNILIGDRKQDFTISENKVVKGTFKNLVGVKGTWKNLVGDYTERCIPDKDSWRYKKVDTSPTEDTKIEDIVDVMLGNDKKQQKNTISNSSQDGGVMVTTNSGNRIDLRNVRIRNYEGSLNASDDYKGFISVTKDEIRIKIPIKDIKEIIIYSVRRTSNFTYPNSKFNLKNGKSVKGEFQLASIIGEDVDSGLETRIHVSKITSIYFN
jgi:hypothetical protein